MKYILTDKTLFCKHSWVMIDKHIFKSPLEVATEQGISTGDGANTCYESGTLSQKITWIMGCKKCGKLKKVGSGL